METEVKERLVGAVILVLLAVLVVPALLSGPKQSPPAPDPAPSRSVEIEFGNAGTGDAVDIVPLDEAAPMPPAGAVREAPTGVPDSAAEVATPVRPPAPAPAASAAPPVRRDVSPVVTGFAVQVAALSNREAARQRVTELQRRGYSAFIVEYRADGRVLYRVRVGPQAAREDAAAVARKLKADGVEGNVVRHP